MSTAKFYDIGKFPSNSQEAIREFDTRYIASIGAERPPTWADIGDMIPTNSPHTTYPIGAFGLSFQRSRGEQRFKKLASKSFDIKTEEFDEGYQAKLVDLMTKVFAYQNWQKGPERLIVAEQNLRNDEIITLLEAGESTAWVDGVNFFSATHLSDITNPASTTWSNYQSSTKDVVSVTNIEAEVVLMQGGVRDENGRKINVNPDTIAVPTAKYQPLVNYLAQAMILDGTGTSGVTNPYVGKFNVVHMPELTDANDWYLMDSKLIAQGLPPWITLRWQVPTGTALALRTWDESSDFFKDTGEIKVSAHVWYGTSLGFPHGIRKVKGA